MSSSSSSSSDSSDFDYSDNSSSSDYNEDLDFDSQYGIYMSYEWRKKQLVAFAIYDGNDSSPEFYQILRTFEYILRNIKHRRRFDHNIIFISDDLYNNPCCRSYCDDYDCKFGKGIHNSVFELANKVHGGKKRLLDTLRKIVTNKKNYT